MDPFINEISKNIKNIIGEIKSYKANKEGSIPIYLWGGGSVAAGVLKKLDENNIRIDGIFVDVKDCHIDSRIHKDIPILTLDEVEDRNVQYSVIVGHSHYELIPALNSREKVDRVWAFADAVRNDCAISYQYVTENLDELQYSFERLEDELSRKNFLAYFNAKITGDVFYLLDVFEKPMTYFQNDICRFGAEETYLDIGAYDGKSIDEFIQVSNGNYRSIIGIEVMKEMANFLSDKYKNENLVSIYNIGISNHIGTDFFSFDDQSTCLVSGNKKGSEIEVETIDHLIQAHDIGAVTLMKICIGSSIKKLLEGAEKTIREHLPKIIISMGIDTDAFRDYIRLIDKYAGKDAYKFYLRLTNASTDTLVLIATPNPR